MNKAHRVTADRVIREVAGWYQRRFWWVSTDELIQECWVAVLENGLVGVADDAVSGAVAKVSRWACSSFCYRSRVQVSPSRNASELVGVQQTPLDQRYAVGEPQQDFHAAPAGQAPYRDSLLYVSFDDAAVATMDPDKFLRSVVQLKRVLRRRISDIPGVPEHLAGAAAAVLVDGMVPSEVAEALDVQASDVYRATRAAKSHLRRDKVALVAAETLAYRREIHS